MRLATDIIAFDIASGQYLVVVFNYLLVTQCYTEDNTVFCFVNNGLADKTSTEPGLDNTAFSVTTSALFQVRVPVFPVSVVCCKLCSWVA